MVYDQQRQQQQYYHQDGGDDAASYGINSVSTNSVSKLQEGAANLSAANSLSTNTASKMGVTSQSQYMKNKLTKSRLEVVHQAVELASTGGSYTGATMPTHTRPPRPSPHQYTTRVSQTNTKLDRRRKQQQQQRFPERSLLDDASSNCSRKSRGSGRHKFSFDSVGGEQGSKNSQNSNQQQEGASATSQQQQQQGQFDTKPSQDGLQSSVYLNKSEASSSTTQYDNTTVGNNNNNAKPTTAMDQYSMTGTDFSTIRSATSLVSSVGVSSAASSDLHLPLPYSKLPIAKPMFGREEELETLQKYLADGASITSLIGVGGVGKSHLATHASRKWFSQQPFSRFVVWLNAATELTLRVSYLEALQQVLMGNAQPEDDSTSQHQNGGGGGGCKEVIIVAELLQRQLRKQRRKEQRLIQKRQEQEKQRQKKKQQNEDSASSAQVFSEDTEERFMDEDDIGLDDEDIDDNEEIPMDTKALGRLLWDSLLQGVPQDYEWLVIVQNLPGGMGGIKGPAGFKEFFFPIQDTPEEEWTQGRILLMTRHDSYAGKTAMGDVKSLSVKRLDEPSSVRMMIASAVFNSENEIGRDNLASPYKDHILKDAERIASKLVGHHYLDGNPLMIATAIGHIVTQKLTLRDYYNSLKQQVAQALQTSGYGNGKVQSSVKRETAMSVCLEQAMDNAHANGLADILSAASFICADSISLELLGGNLDRVRQLCKMNLLSQTGKDMYSMHRVHQRTAVDAIITNIGTNGEDESEAETEIFLCTLDQAVINLRSALADFHPEKASTWKVGRSCIVHVEALRNHYDVLERKKSLSSDFQHGYYADIVNFNASVMQWAMKDRLAAITMYKEALRLRRTLHREAIADEFRTLLQPKPSNDLASALSQTLSALGGLVDDDQEAQVYYKEALDIYCQAFGENTITIELMTLYIALADVEAKLKYSDQAYKHYKKAIELYFLIYGHNQDIYADDQKMFLAETLQKIGDLTHYQMKNYAEAELYLEGTVSLLQHLYDHGCTTKTEEMATALEMLGNICHAQGKMKEARQYYRNALKMKDRIYADWKDGKNRYGGAAEKSKSVSDRSGFTNTTEYDDSDDDSDSECEGDDLNSEQMHKHREGYGVEVITTESRIKALSEKDAKMARTLHRLGVMSWNLGNLKQAQDYFEKTQELQKKAYGEDGKNEDIAITLFSLGGLCNDLQDDQIQASGYYRRALECYYHAYGINAQNESIAQLLHALGQSLVAQNELEEARSCLKKALDIKYLIYGGRNEVNEDVVTALQDLGKVSRDLKATEDARFYYLAALDGLYKLHGKDVVNPQIISVLTQLGGLSFCSGLLIDAKKYFEKALVYKYQLYGDDAYNDDLASTLNNLGSICARQKDHGEAFEYYKLALDQYSRLSKDKENRQNLEIKLHLARTLHNLGLLSYNLQQFEEAKKFYSQSLKIKSQVYKEDPDAPDMALTLSKLSSVETKLGNTDTAKYYQNQALKRSPTFLETHKKLINKHLLPATPEEAAALISMIPPDSPDYMDHEVITRSLHMWEGLKGISSHNNHSKSCLGGFVKSDGRDEEERSIHYGELPNGVSTFHDGGHISKSCWYPMKNLREKKKRNKKKGGKTKRKY